MTEDYSERWAEALSLLAPLITRTDLRKLAAHATFDVQPSYERSVALVYFRLRAVSLHHDSSIEMVINPVWHTFHPIEQLEAMCWAAVVAHCWFSAGVSWSTKESYPIQAAYCKQLGCALSSSTRPSTRWHRIAITGTDYGRLQDFAAQHYPSVWPNYCSVCKRFINSDEQREDVHDNCLTYAKAVLVPALRLQRAAEAAELKEEG